MAYKSYSAIVGQNDLNMLVIPLPLVELFH